MIPDPSRFFPEWWRPQWTPYLILLAVLLGFFVGVWLTGLWLRIRQRRSGSKHGRLGRRAEKKAVRVLRRNGYQIEEHQPGFQHRLRVNGQSKRFTVTPDLVVSRGDSFYVVEVKRLSKGGSIGKAGVRRQVLEYLVASGLPCLLVSMPEGRIETIELTSDMIR